MKRACLLSIILSVVTMLSLACNEIENVNPEVRAVVGQNQTTLALSINVTQEEAYSIADRFVSSGLGSDVFLTKSANMKSKHVKSSATVREDGKDLMHVFNFEGGGFIVIGATRNYYPILAYSDKGSFVLKDDMGPVDVWLDETKVFIKNSELSDETTKSQMQSLWARFDGTYTDPTLAFQAAHGSQTRSTGEDACWERIDSLQALFSSEGWTFSSLSNVEYYFTEWGLSALFDEICNNAEQNHSDPDETIIGYKYPVVNHVGPLLETHWKQEYPFNKYCNGYLAGCGVIAAAQLVKHYEYPDTLSWNGFNFTLGNSDVPVEIDEFSKQPHLVMRLAQAFQIPYAPPSGNSTFPAQVANGLNSIGYVANDTTHIYTLVKYELLNYSRPVIMMGYRDINLTLGHAWVCDGVYEYFNNAVTFFTENQPYGTGTFTQGMYSLSNPGFGGGYSNTLLLFSMNWGWEGDYDGWYISDSADSGDGYNYQYHREDVFASIPLSN